MERSTRRSPITGTVLTLALLAGALVGLTSAPAGAQIPYPDTERIGVDNAVDAGIAISKRLYADDAAGAVVLTRQDKFPDGLAASALAGEKDAPILFTPTNQLAAKTRAEIDRVLADGGTVYLMGGTVALSAAIEDELDAAGYFTPRISGEDRNATASLTARFFVKAGPGNTALLVRGRGSAGNDSTQGWPDAISCGGFAANTDTPVLLTNPNRDALPASTVQALNELNIAEVFVCGGTAAVPSSHAAQLSSMGIRVARFAGATRVTTAIDVAKRLWQKGASTDGDHFILINGYRENFFYGIAAAPLSGKNSAPLLIVDTNEPNTWPVDCSNLPSRSAATLCYLNGDGDDRVGSLILMGTTGVVTDSVFEAAAKAAGLPEDTNPPSVPANVAATDTPEDDGTQITVTWDASTDDTSGDITYTVYVRESAEEAMTTANSTKAGTVKNATSFTVTGRTPDTEYEVAVTATDQFGNTSELSATATATPSDESPGAPEAAPNVQSVPGPAVKVSWLEAPEGDVAGYKVERAAPGLDDSCDESPVVGATYSEVGSVDGKSTLSFTDEDVAAGDEYCYRYRSFDSTGNASGASPAARILVAEVSSDTTAPSQAPSFYAVNFDQQRGLVASTANSRSSSGSYRVDVVVPAGAFEAGEKDGPASVVVYEGNSELTEHAFTVTGSEQIVSVDISPGSGSADISASLKDAGGNESTRSSAWTVSVDSATYQPTPRIVSVEGVDVDPLNHLDARIPIVGGDSPKIDATPSIEVANLSSDTELTIWVNNTLRYRQCLNLDPGQTRATLNASETDSDLTLDPGSPTLVVSARSCSAPDPVRETTRSGDSNSVIYSWTSAAFGVASFKPAPGSSDPFGYGDTVTLEAVFNKATTTGSTLTLVKPGGATVTATNGAAGGDVEDTTSDGDNIIRFTQPGPLPPGTYKLVVDATAADDSSQTSSEQASFVAGFVHQVHLDAAAGANTQSTRASGFTLVVAAEAPSGTYRVYDEASGSGLPLGSVDHTQGSQSRASNDSGSAADVADGSDGAFWTYQRPTSQGGATTARQNDGTVPVALAADNGAASPQGTGLLGIRQQGAAQLIVDGADALPSRGYSYEVYYRPSVTSGFPASTNYQTDPALARNVSGQEVAFANDRISPSWDVRYYVRNPGNGNIGPQVQDGTLRTVSSITPQNGQGNPPALPGSERLEDGDILRVDFNSSNVALDTSLAPSTATGGLVIETGPDGSMEVANPRFTTGSGGSVTFTSAASFSVVFGSASTLASNQLGATGQPVDAPTRLHGGSVRIAINWLVNTNDGHALLMLLPSEAEGIGDNGYNAGTF